MLFADVLSLHLVTFLMFFILVSMSLVITAQTAHTMLRLLGTLAAQIIQLGYSGYI